MMSGDGTADQQVFVDQNELEDKLLKIRSQINSKLDNQKHLAIILSAVEENIEEQNDAKTPISYVVSFLSLLDQCIKDDKIIDGSLAASTTYFLDLLFPFTPKPFLKQKFKEILLKISQLLNVEADAPLARSAIGAIESLLLAQDNLLWTTHRAGAISPNRAFLALIELSFDARPKVRRRAQEAVKSILEKSSTNMNSVHITGAIASDASLKRLKDILYQGKKNKKKSNIDKDTKSQIIHCLQLIATIASTISWPVENIEDLCDALLDVSKTTDQFLVAAAFEAFEGLFKSMTNVVDIAKYTKVLDIIFDLKPSTNDIHLSTTWLRVVAKALEGYSMLSPLECIKRLPQVLVVVSQLLLSDSKDLYTNASNCLVSIISQTIPDKFLLQPNTQYSITEDIYEVVDSTITFIAEMIETELFSIKYQHAIGSVLAFVKAAILKFQSRANPDFLSIIKTIGDWRTNEADHFPHNKEAEECIGAAISAIGPEAVLSVLPLNLGDNGTNTNTSGGGGPGRAWLLPLLRDNVRCAQLNYYKIKILPTVEFFRAQIENSSQRESMNNKIFQTIIDQVWSLLPRFCDLPRDLISAFDEKFATELADLMFAQVDLRPFICHAWKMLVTSNLSYRDGVSSSVSSFNANDDNNNNSNKNSNDNNDNNDNKDDVFLLLHQQEFPREEAAKNIEYLKSIASNILTVLFNVFSYTMPESRGFVLEAIEAYLQILPVPEIASTFDKVCGMLKTALDEEEEKKKKESSGALKKAASADSTPDTSVTMMDLIVAMAKYLPDTSHNALFSIFAITVSLESKPLLQKRSYRIITNLCESEQGKKSITKYIGDIESMLVKTADCTNQSSRSARLSVILLVLDILPSTDLFFIPSILQEIIMATKDVNEKTRGLSYQILIKMGHKMRNGGLVDNSKVPGFEPGAEPTQASLTEFFTMVSAGLAAQNPHMISATITAISCLVFEFRGDLPAETLVEIASTVELFLTHNSREIAKSAIGFVKVEVLSLPEEMVKQNLQELLTKLMRWSHEHKGHFKSKVKHIIERLIKKFGVEEVENAIPEEDQKLVANIKKARNRAKRKQELEKSTSSSSSSILLSSTGEGNSSKVSNKKNKKFVSAYEEALYDSDVSDDDEVDIYDEDAEKIKKGNRKFSQVIVESGDDPLDLLDRQALAHIHSSKSQRMVNSKSDKQALTKNGKLYISENGITEEDPLAKKSSGVDAYLDAVKQAPVRGQKNKLKFKKTKNGDDDIWSDDDNDDGNNNESKSKRQATTKHTKVLGKSKISKPKNKQKYKAQKKL
ncbi:RRP12 [Candida oxycetoniae]|uniref:RRP12 n=1 Tax=Candida oxycetoniae TaxID=497107 RepID=A0AAI9SXA5_9ASCO|nr:RRP12 [Candida oxycetoniae]KAI3404779.2 RRP12 [Candida oxycetoniae]